MKTLKAGSEGLERILNAWNRISGVSDDSRKVKKGEVFVAVKGKTSDGHDFIPAAINKGIKLIVGEDNIKVPDGVIYCKVSDSREALGFLASRFYGNPSDKLIVIGVTGTKGKTTTCHLIAHILEKLGQKTKLISTVTVGGFHTTTPDVVSLHKLLKEAVDEGCKYAVVEVSSHGIDQKRIVGVKFAVGVLTNIAPEHLDYHKTFTEYKRVKLSFIDKCRVKIIAKTKTDLNILPGKFNNLNAQAAVDVVVALRYDKNDAIKALHSFKLPEGRLEEVNPPAGGDPGFKIFIDFAHTPDSLEAVLKYLKAKTGGNLIAVFGCAGERDKFKRPKMGEVASGLSDAIILTSEDPRTEDVNEIIRQIKSGIKTNTPVYIIPDREKAIKKALKIAKSGDIVGLFGKGHEKSMNLDGIHETPWSDMKVVRKYLQGNIR